MFCQVRVTTSDCDWLRFLWWQDGDIERPLLDHRMLVHVFGATSSPSCANYALKSTADDNKNQFDSEVVDTLRTNFYVDDCLRSTSTEDKAVTLAHELSAICEKGGFHLTKWISNRKSVMESIPMCERAETTKNLDLDSNSLPSHKALGMLWLMETDSFNFQIDISDKPPTRRGMLSILSSVYDPLGLVSPVILPAKQILQGLCRNKLGWDDEVPGEYQKKWNQWTTSLPELEQLDVTRCLKPEGFESPSSAQIHHFADASDDGYGTATYLRLTNEDGDVECNLLMGKSRVAPIKKVSIPRMELTAATGAVKIDSWIKQELEIPVDQTFFWTDSETVLKYVQNEKARFPVFVANRLAIIHDGSSVDQWRYVPTNVNPADYASRGMTVSQLIAKKQWLKGPDFLTEVEECWPSTKERSTGKHDISGPPGV